MVKVLQEIDEFFKKLKDEIGGLITGTEDLFSSAVLFLHMLLVIFKDVSEITLTFTRTLLRFIQRTEQYSEVVWDVAFIGFVNWFTGHPQNETMILVVAEFINIELDKLVKLKSPLLIELKDFLVLYQGSVEIGKRFGVEISKDLGLKLIVSLLARRFVTGGKKYKPKNPYPFTPHEGPILPYNPRNPPHLRPPTKPHTVIPDDPDNPRNRNPRDPTAHKLNPRINRRGDRIR